jgi:glycine cleavage system H lipoate-binding protein/ABC-type phosphate transport system substrate-binding protein
MNYSNLYCNESVTSDNPASNDSLRIMSTPDLYNLSNKWATEYKRLYPETKIKVITVSDEKTADKLITEGSIGFVSNEYYSGHGSESILKLVVGRDVIVPIINSKNPLLVEINKHGISPEAFARFFINPDSGTWGTLLGNGEKSKAVLYRINDESISNGLTLFLKTDKIKTGGIEVENGENMILAIQKDPFAIGFCKMISILDPGNQGIAENISLLPIDRNGNGLIENTEKIYDDFNVFSRGVWIGKYPKVLISNIYSISQVQPDNESGIAFLKWIFTDGQQFLSGNGYSDLLLTERQTTVDRIYNAKVYPGAAMNDKSLLKTLLFIIASVILAGLIIDTIARYRNRKKAEVKITASTLRPVINEDSLKVPAGLYFDKTHTWAFMEQNGMVKVGIDDFLQHITGPITRIKLKDPGSTVKKGDQILSIIQNGKQLNLYAPVSGIIKEQNKVLETNSSLINSSPYTEGWIYKIEPTNWLRENPLLFMAEKQKTFIKNEFSRLKDFLAAALNADAGKYAQVVLQDGGELKDGALSNLGPEVWEDFQTKFIDPSRQVWFYELY